MNFPMQSVCRRRNLAVIRISTRNGSPVLPAVPRRFAQRKESPVFVSFFPKPRLFFWSALAWTILVIIGWYTFGENLGAAVGLPPAAADAPPIIGISVFWSAPFL